jgi:hypothetical protein
MGMAKHVSSNTRLSATAIEDLKAEIAAHIVAQLKEYLAELLAGETAARNDRSVSGFCRRWGISRFLFYDKPHEMPATMHVGGRTLISPEAEALWVRKREEAAKTAPKRVVGRARSQRETEAEAPEKQNPAQRIA